MDSCPSFCSDCPVLPDGVAAILARASSVTRSELAGYKFAHDAPELADQLAELVRIEAEVVSSNRLDIAVGETATMLIRPISEGPNELRKSIRQCGGPRYTRLQRFIQFLRLSKVLKGRGTCGCIDHSWASIN